MEYLVVDWCTPARLRARERVQPIHLLAAANPVTGSIHRVPSVVGAQTLLKGLRPKTHLHGIERRTLLYVGVWM